MFCPTISRAAEGNSVVFILFKPIKTRLSRCKIYKIKTAELISRNPSCHIGVRIDVEDLYRLIIAITIIFILSSGVIRIFSGRNGFLKSRFLGIAWKTHVITQALTFLWIPVVVLNRHLVNFIFYSFEFVFFLIISSSNIHKSKSAAIWLIEPPRRKMAIWTETAIGL